MKDNWPESVKLVLHSEGGYVDNPHDPGGQTNRGITQREYDRYRGRKGLPLQSVYSLNQFETEEIYHEDYWDCPPFLVADQLPIGLDYAVFDFAVNSGPQKAVMTLQEIVGVAHDGKCGPMTLASILQHDPKQLIDELCEARLEFLEHLSTWKFFGEGWTNRVNAVKETAERMVA